MDVQSTPAASCAATARRLQARLLLALLGFTAAIFGGVCGHQFVSFDDNVNIYENSHVQGLSWENLRWMFSDTTYARRYMPLGWLSYALDYQLFGPNPQAYHIGNLLLHLCNVVLLFFLLKHLLRLAIPSSNTAPGAAAPVWCAAVGALFWAVNPLRVEVVAWASSRIYCLVVFCSLSSVLAWLHAQNSVLPQQRRRLFYGLALAAYAASLLTYPLALFAPIALIVLEVYPLRRLEVTLRSISSAWPVWRDKLPFLILAATILGVSLVARTANSAIYQPASLAESSLLSRLMQAFYLWAYYVWKPWDPYDLSPIYPILHSFNPVGPGFLASAAFVLLVSTALFLLRRRWPAALGIWLCHLVLLIPVLGLSEYHHSPYDRYSYFQGVLWSIAIALVLRNLWERGKQGTLAAVAVTAAAVLFAPSAWQQVSVWNNTISLHQCLLTRMGEHPCRARFDEVLGVHYLQYGLTNEAVACFTNALYYQARRLDGNRYQESLIPRTHIRLGDIYADQKQYEEALAHYQTASALDPGSINTLLKLGSALAILHRESEGIACFNQALRLQPNNSQAHHNLAVALRKMGREEEALQHFTEERRLSLNP